MTDVVMCKTLAMQETSQRTAVTSIPFQLYFTTPLLFDLILPQVTSLQPCKPVMLINLISIALYASWPQYMAIFLHGAAHNPDVRFTLISNIDEHHPSWEHNFGNITKPNNVVIVPHTFKSIVSLIKKDNLGLGADLSISNPYKLIDFKPMYGVMFAKELIGFTHWGWFDLDIFVGDIKSMYECGYRGEDVLSYDRTIVQGPLMVLRNTEFVNTFYLNLLSTSYMLNHLLQGTAVLFDERYFPNLIKRNASIVSKALQSRDCDPGECWLSVSCSNNRKCYFFKCR